MKYEVKYLRKKSKGYSQQSATFLKIEDAIFWESIIKTQGAKEIIICPK
jgi:hypothetical protein